MLGDQDLERSVDRPDRWRPGVSERCVDRRLRRQRPVTDSAKEMNANRIARAERKAHDVRYAVMIVVGEQRRSAMRRRAERDLRIELKRSLAAVDADAVGPVIRDQQRSIAIHIADILDPFAKGTRQQALARERAVSAIRQQRERAELVDLIAGCDDLRSAVAIEIADEHHLIGLRRVPDGGLESAQKKEE